MGVSEAFFAVLAFETLDIGVRFEMAFQTFVTGEGFVAFCADFGFFAGMSA